MDVLFSFLAAALDEKCACRDPHFEKRNLPFPQKHRVSPTVTWVMSSARTCPALPESRLLACSIKDAGDFSSWGAHVLLYSSLLC